MMGQALFVGSFKSSGSILVSHAGTVVWFRPHFTGNKAGWR